MRLTFALLSAIVAVAAAQPHHRHGHQHLRREAQPDPVADVVIVPGPTMITYVLNGQPISEAEVQQGLANGTLVLEGNGQLSSAVDSSTSSFAPPTSTSTYVLPTSSSSSQYVAPTTSTQEPAPTSQAAATSSVAPAPASSSHSAPAPSSASAPSYGSSSSDGVDQEFPDGQLDCSTFPSDYGAVAVDWIGLGGWTGVQTPGSSNGGFSNIMTATKGTCNGVNCCTEGSYCSYACPAGYQKSQWPSTQGATGQSVGGILCQGGKLRLTNPDLSKSLCMTGTEEVSVLVQNSLSSNVAVCRTDYPGTEGETVPLDTQAGTTNNLTCPDAANYYTWEGGHTSAQYYVNPKGVSVSDACQWGSPANPWGNYAPLNLGVGYSNGAAWLSIFQNLPTTSAQLDFTVEITGSGLSGTCRYSNGQYCSGASYDQCSSTTGCTVSVSPGGTATFVFS